MVGLSKQYMDVMEPMAPIEVRHIRDQLSGQLRTVGLVHVVLSKHYLDVMVPKAPDEVRRLPFVGFMRRTSRI